MRKAGGGRLEAEEMIRTLDANYLFTFHLPRPASGPAPFHLSSGSVLRVLLGLFERHFRRALKTPTAVVPPLKRIYGANGSLNFRCRRSMQNPSVRIGQCADLYGVFPAINVGLKHNIEKETLFFIKVPRFGGCF